MHDIACVVCPITQNDVLMVPANNVCHQGYVLEYKGCLMSSYSSHSTSEFICVDDKQETESGYVNRYGRIVFFVESVCSSLSSPPHAEMAWNLHVLCVSFLPVVESSSFQPYASPYYIAKAILLSATLTADPFS